MKHFRFLLLLAATMCAVFASVNTAAARTVNGSDYSLTIPDDWEVMPKEPGAMIDVVVASPLQGEGDTFRENMNVMVDKLPSGMSEQEWLELNREQLQQMGATFIQDFTPTKVNGQDAYYGRFLLSVQGVECDDDSYIFFRGSTIFVISCISQKDTRDEFQPQMKKVVESFVIETSKVSDRPTVARAQTFEGVGYTVHFSKDWTVTEPNDGRGTDVIAFLKPRAIDGVIFRPNINIRRDKLPKGTTPRQYIDTNIEQLTKMGAKFKTGFEPEKVGNFEGYHAHFLLSIQNLKFDDDCYIVIKDGIAYTLTCTNGAGGMREATEAEMQAVVDSFKLK